MKRLFQILYLLSDKRRVTAKELSEYFGVSIRTIHRDIDILSISGIPIYTQQGRNGGIALMENYVFDKGILGEEEQQQIITALEAMKVVPDKKYIEVVKKLRVMFRYEKRNWVDIDFSDWSNRNKELYNNLKNAILTCNIVKFHYYNRYGEMTTRTVEPIQLYFKGNSWYLKAYCLEKEELRYFKITRIKNLSLTNEQFNLRNYDDIKIKENLQQENKEPSVTKTILHINKVKAFQVYDSFDEHEIEVKEDGSFIVTIKYPIDQWFYSMIMSYGADAKVLEPDKVKKEIGDRIKQSYDNYF